MAKEEKMQRIDVVDLPARKPGRPSKYPYEEWEKLEPGQATEVELDGRSAHPMAAGLNAPLSARGLAVTVRQGRLFVFRPEEAP